MTPPIDFRPTRRRALAASFVLTTLPFAIHLPILLREILP